MTTKFPVLVQFEFHPASAEAAATAEFLHTALNADPSVPGLQVPTCFTPDDGTGEPPEPRIAIEADRVLVVVLADDHFAAHARTPTSRGRTWGDYVVQLRQICEAAAVRFMPVQLTENGWPLDARLRDINFLRAWTAGDVHQRRKLIARRLVHLLIRQLRPHPQDEDAPPVTIFLSHSKTDLEDEPRVVRALLAHLSAMQPERAWFDSGDIATGSRLATEIERGVADSALLAVVTDSYSSRSWCRREVLLAKHHQRPVVVVDAVQDGEVRRFPYAGNTPVMRWKGDPQDAVDLLLREALRYAYAEESLSKRKQPDDAVLPAGPELVTIVHRNKDQPILYPDPPLGSEELAVLFSAGVRVETPLERHARANDLRARALSVAISVSRAEDLGRFGLRMSHLDGIFLELSRYILLAGVRLAYGGHLRADGYTMQLAELLRDPAVEQLRGVPPGAQTPSAELLTYLAWPMPSSARDEARLGPLVEVRRCERPTDLDETDDPAFVAQPQGEIPLDSALHRFAWARGLTTMRERQTQEVAGRVIVGGRLGPMGEGYRGRMPGVLEEALLSIRAERPVYLVGAFGGCAQLILDALEGVPRRELTWGYQRAVPHSDELKALYQTRGVVWDEHEAIASDLRARGLAGLKNGLTTDENRELGATRSPERIVALVLRGIQQSYSPGGINPPA